ncbi:MAG: CotH kinase family protein [Lachnospiraceae bacterium]|nr:CotH kinase family protein [Lachnospiraceae bacterium]
MFGRKKKEDVKGIFLYGWKRRFLAKGLAAVLVMTAFGPLGTPVCGYAEEMENLPEQTEAVQEERRITHGTADEWITEDMVNNEPPKDYVVNRETQGEAENGTYRAYFLEDTIQTVSIEIEENNLNYLLQNALEEPYVMTNSVTIGDVTLGYCGLKTKGSFTLEHSVTENEGSDRFSFTISFGKYIKKKEYGEKQNFFGCDKISFNNFFFDKTMMKEFFALKLLDEMGLPTPQYGLAKLYINGNYYGVYAMVEAMDHSILERYYGVDKDELSSYLCKPEGTNFLYEAIAEDPSPLWEQDEDTLKDVEDMLPTVTEWVRRLNCLSEGTDFEGNELDVNSGEYLQLLNQVLDTDEVVKYFAVHSWLCQMDNMFVGQKNFGLYVDQNGRALLVPWDYDLSFGCYYPSTAETTANYDIDVMYRLNFWEQNQEELISKETYQQFPLFHVIYQNEALMKQYHDYMKECSKVASLGGMVESTGKTYEPGFFYSFVERMEEEVTAAATEKLADNVYYMNEIIQPQGVKRGLPNLAEIIALRAVGVAHQVDGVDATVCGAGCNLLTLGNGSPGESSVKGWLTVVDAATGIYATARYASTNRTSPELKAEKLSTEEVIYKMFRTELGLGENDTMIVYKMTNEAVPKTAYTLTLPMSVELMQAEGEFTFYTHVNGALEELPMTAEDNLYTGTVDTLDYILVVKRTGDGTENELVQNPADGMEADSAAGKEALQEEQEVVTISPAVIVFGVIVIVLLLVALLFIKKRKKK